MAKDKENIAVADEALKTEIHATLLAEFDERLKSLENSKGQSVTVAQTAFVIDVPSETFIFEDKKYKFLVAGIFHENKKILAKDALEDVELQAIFVKEYPKTVKKI